MKKNLEILQNIEGDIGAYPTLQYRKKKLAVKIYLIPKYHVENR